MFLPKAKPETFKIYEKLVLFRNTEIYPTKKIK